MHECGTLTNGVVSQEPVLFARSIRTNARFGCPAATDDEMWVALEQSNVADFVRSLEKGLDTWARAYSCTFFGLTCEPFKRHVG